MAEIEILTLANHAEAINGLLYLSGAGWNRHARRYGEGSPPPVHHFGIGVSVLVPWIEANRKLRLALWIEHEDGGDPLFRAEGELEVGRPPGVPEGSDLRTVLAVDAIVQYPTAGGYRLVAEVDGQRRSCGFIVVDEVVGMERAG